MVFSSPLTLNVTHAHDIRVTFIWVEDWKHAPEGQYDLHLKDVVDVDAGDEEDEGHTKTNSKRKNDVGIYRYGNQTGW